MKALCRILAAAGAALGVIAAGILLSVIFYPDEQTPGWFMALTFLLALAVFIYILVKALREDGFRDESPDRRDADRPICSGRFFHVSGLNLPPEVKCIVRCWPDRLTFSAMNQEFAIDNRKVRSVARTTHKQLRQQYVSSAGGAVAGAALFGPLGAAVGGGVKRKTVRDYTRYLIFAYGGAGEDTKYIILRRGEWGSNGRSFVAAYKKRLKGSRTHVEL